MKALLTVSYVVDVENHDELAELIRVMEDSASSSLKEVMDKHATTLSETADVFEFYGIASSTKRETLEDTL